ncbi:MAG: GrpB family protein [Candidatus Rokuibacteriota bacterium]
MLTLRFVKGMPPFGARRTHHVHVRTPDDTRTALLFTDNLRRDPAEAARHAELKRDLAARHSTDRDAYPGGEARYVDDIVRKAESR